MDVLKKDKDSEFHLELMPKGVLMYYKTLAGEDAGKWAHGFFDIEEFKTKTLQLAGMKQIARLNENNHCEIEGSGCRLVIKKLSGDEQGREQMQFSFAGLGKNVTFHQYLSADDLLRVVIPVQ